MELDEFDRRLLAALQEDNRRTGEELAALVGLSAAACLRRAQRLRGSGVIERDISVLAPEAVDLGLSLVVLVSVNRDRVDAASHFTARMEKAPEVGQCYSVTGDADFVLIVAVRDMKAYEAFTRRYFYERYVTRYETMVVINRTKFSTVLPVAKADEP
ncbi:MAG: Lrp/AsnC family transcriptional regulator [Kiloniellales bacterium]